MCHLAFEQHRQAMIRAHLFGVRELEEWAMRSFATTLAKRADGVPEALLGLVRQSKDLMW